MICPICKKTIPDNTLKCPYCKARTGLVCKNCNTINSIFDYTCKNCGSEILKVCPNCSSINLPNSLKCRKCGYKFEIEKKFDDKLALEYSANFVSQKNAKNILVKGLTSNEKKVFSISGEKGCGKSLVLKNIQKELKNFFWLQGKCTPLTQITPGGVIQNILLNTFNFPDFCIENDEFKHDTFSFFKNKFPELNNKEIYNLINFLYPVKEGTFEAIISGKNNTYKFLNKVFDKFVQDGNFVLVIDNFDFIDGFSYEFISKFIKKENVWKNLKLLLLYNDPKPSKGYFYFPSNKDNIYLDVAISPLDYSQAYSIYEQKAKKFKDFPKISNEEFQEIYKMSFGNPSYINHALLLRYECFLTEQQFELSNSFKGLLEHRLALLSHLNPDAYNMLIGSAIIGDKININLIKEIFQIDNKNFKKILIYLKKFVYINLVNNIYCEFSSQLLWETIIKTSKRDDNYEKINEKIFSFINDFTINSYAMKGIIAQNLKQTELSLQIWTQNTKLASYIGDLNLYAISQKQSLALINEFDESETLKIRYNISERLGKLLANSNPKEAMEYLPDAISNAQAVGNSPKEIELLAYLASCCRKTGNYFGEVECVDNVLQKIKPENIIDNALLKTTKLQALLNIGNCGQIVNMIDNEILPVFEQFFSKKNSIHDSRTPLIYESLVKTYLVLANALILQGNDRSFEVLDNLFEIINKNNIQDNLLICKCKLSLAFANTMKGDFKASEKLLEEVLKNYQEDVMDNETIIRWNFINIINNFFRNKYDKMQEDLFQIVTFANNNGDNFTKNILKTLLGKVFQDNENYKQAMEIYNDQIAYFAKEKIVLGALLTWYLIADNTLNTEGSKSALEIAQKTLEIAQNPKIDNHFFSILLKTVIAKCHITSGDFESAKIYIEESIITAKQFNMKDLLSRLYIFYGKYFQELGLVKTPQQEEFLQSADKLYAQARVLIEETKNKNVYEDLKKAQNVLRSFCQLHSIEL